MPYPSLGHRPPTLARAFLRTSRIRFPPKHHRRGARPRPPERRTIAADLLNSLGALGEPTQSSSRLFDQRHRLVSKTPINSKIAEIDREHPGARELLAQPDAPLIIPRRWPKRSPHVARACDFPLLFFERGREGRREDLTRPEGTRETNPSRIYSSSTAAAIRRGTVPGATWIATRLHPLAAPGTDSAQLRL